MTPLPYFPADWPLTEARRAWFEAQGFSPVPYQQSAHARTARAFLLVSPMRVGANFVRPEGVWAQYLAAANPSAVLLQAGYRNRAVGSNYLSWGDLPADFGLFLQNAQRVGDGWLPPDFGENRLEVVWQRFWEGHNKAGFADWFSATMRFLQITDGNLQKGPEQEKPRRAYLAEDDNQLSFKNTHLRWKAYKPYLLLAPFSDEIEKAGDLLQQIETGWEDCSDYQSLSARIHAHRLRIESLDELLIHLSQYFKTDTP
jgi:hypothetical protein